MVGTGSSRIGLDMVSKISRFCLVSAVFDPETTVPSKQIMLYSCLMESLYMQVIQPINGDPFIGMLETPVTSSPLVANYLSNLPAYRTGVSPLLRGVEIGLAHGFLLVGPFIKLGPLRDFAGASGNAAEIAGCMSAAGLVLILTMCLSMYGQVTFQNDVPQVGVKTLSGRNIARDPLQSSEGWSKFAAGWAVGGLSGVAWGYVCTQILPYYQ